jgi:hypothetical protein
MERGLFLVLVVGMDMLIGSIVIYGPTSAETN